MRSSLFFLITVLSPFAALAEPDGDIILEAMVTEVTFSQGNAILNDSGTAMATPHWEDKINAANPEDPMPDGVADSVAGGAAPNNVKSYAYSYVSNKKPCIIAKFKWKTAPPASRKPYKASGKVINTPNSEFTLKKQTLGGDTDYPATVAEDNIVKNRAIQAYLTDNRKVVRKNSGGTDATANLVPLVIEWTVYDKDDNEISKSQSSHTIYVTWDEPATPLRRETLFNLGCGMANNLSANNATEQRAVFDKIWDDFTDREVLRMNNTPMKYWGNGAAFGAAGGQTTAYLLENADGRCGAWADFLVDCTKAQSLTTAKKVSIIAYPFVAGFQSGGATIPGVCGIPAPGIPGNGISIKALPGQSNQTPPQNFVDHAVVAWSPTFPAAVPITPPPNGTNLFDHLANLFNNAQADVQIHIYDPSYGKKTLGTRAYETASLNFKAYALQGPNGWLPQASNVNEDAANQDCSFYNN